MLTARMAATTAASTVAAILEQAQQHPGLCISATKNFTGPHQKYPIASPITSDILLSDPIVSDNLLSDPIVSDSELSEFDSIRQHAIRFR